MNKPPINVESEFGNLSRSEYKAAAAIHCLYFISLNGNSMIIFSLNVTFLMYGICEQ